MAAPPYRERLLQLHRTLVEAESVTGREATAGAVLTAYLEKHGFVCSQQPLPPCANTDAGQTRQNVLAWPRAGAGGGGGGGTSARQKPRLLVTAHLDTVPPHIAYGIDAGAVTAATRIWGRGSVDAKASVAAQVVAVEELLAAGAVAADDVMLLYVVGEEEGGDGMRLFSEWIHGEAAGSAAGSTAGDAAASTAENMAGPVPFGGFKAVLFGEPTDNKLARGHKGLLLGTIRARGRAGHSGYPWLGQSATGLLVAALARAAEADLGSSEAYGQTTLNVGVLRGGVAGNVIAEAASADVVLRVAAGPADGGHEAVQARLLQVLRDVDPDAFSCEWRGGYGAVPCCHDVEGFDTIMVNFGTDAPVLAGDYERYLYGPGTILVAHSDHEALTLGEMERAVADYQKLILHALRRV